MHDAIISWATLRLMPSPLTEDTWEKLCHGEVRSGIITTYPVHPLSANAMNDEADTNPSLSSSIHAPANMPNTDTGGPPTSSE
jgi:hypothetical protein